MYIHTCKLCTMHSILNALYMMNVFSIVMNNDIRDYISYTHIHTHTQFTLHIHTIHTHKHTCTYAHTTIHTIHTHAHTHILVCSNNRAI